MPTLKLFHTCNCSKVVLKMMASWFVWNTKLCFSPAAVAICSTMLLPPSTVISVMSSTWADRSHKVLGCHCLGTCNSVGRPSASVAVVTGLTALRSEGRFSAEIADLQFQIYSQSADTDSYYDSGKAMLVFVSSHDDWGDAGVLQCTVCTSGEGIVPRRAQSPRHRPQL